jgi:PTS system nitrogen regulatory IIA component
MQLNELLTPKRIAVGMAASSKKRALEKISSLLHQGRLGLDRHAAFQALVERERLGSTGIGNGIALPHGRLKALRNPIGAFATLARETDFDSIDGKPVRIIFALLVPQNANEEHLQILSTLAATFSDNDFCDRLLTIESVDEAYQALNDCHSSISRKAG